MDQQQRKKDKKIIYQYKTHFFMVRINNKIRWTWIGTKNVRYMFKTHSFMDGNEQHYKMQMDQHKVQNH